MKLSENLKALRNNTNLSQKKLGERIKVSNASINSWENGINEPKASYLIALADFFGVTTDYLLGRENEAGIIEISGDRVIPEMSKIQLLFDKLSKTNQFYLLCYGQGLLDTQ
ncbi:MAG: helix-turn-helix transcriptional regulator [Clostridia bacterium]